MAREELARIAATVLVAVLTGVVGVLAVLFQEWSVRRTRAGRRKLVLEDATRQVTFATEWWKARQLIADSPEAMGPVTARASAWLDEASSVAAAADRLPLDEESAVTLRRLLLAGPFQSRAARIIRVLFYLCLGAAVWAAGTLITDALGHPGRSFRGDLVIFLVWAALALMLRFWAVSAENATSRGGEGSPVTTRRLLLLDRRRGRAAIFYAWGFFIALVVCAAVLDVRHQWQAIAEDVAVIIVLVAYAVGLWRWADSARRERKT